MSGQMDIDRNLSDEHLDGVLAGMALVVETMRGLAPDSIVTLAKVQEMITAWVERQREYNKKRCTV